MAPTMPSLRRIHWRISDLATGSARPAPQFGGMTPDVGTELVNPAVGTKTVFTATAASTDGAYVEIEATYPPNSPKPPLHKHPTQTEQFTVLAGSLHVLRGDEPFTAGH